ncbi:MAG: hypothetical protein WC708_19895 [Lentisphaeria bacterium]
MKKAKLLLMAIFLVSVPSWCNAETDQEDIVKPAYIYADHRIWEAKPIFQKALYPSQTVTTRTLTLSMTAITVLKALRHICMSAGLEYRLENDYIIIAPLSYEFSTVRFQIFTVTPAFARALEPAANDDAAAQNYLASFGLDFSSQQFNLRYTPEKRLLFVRHGAEGMVQLEKTLRLLGMFESKAFDLDVPLPPPPKTVFYQRQLDLVIPLLEAENMPVRKLLLLLADKAKAVDPEHKGISFVFAEDQSEIPIVLTEPPWLQHTDSTVAPKEKKPAAKP